MRRSILGGQKPEFPKRLPIPLEQKGRDFWIRFFEHQYQEECTRLDIQPDPQQLDLEGKILWPYE